MQEKSLIRIALSCMIIGLIFLYFFAEEVSIPTIKSLENSEIEETTKITGEITSLKIYENVVHFKIIGTKEIKTDIIFFPQEEPFLKNGQYVNIEGITEKYNGKKQVIASSVTIE